LPEPPPRHANRKAPASVQDHLIQFLRGRQELFPFRHDAGLRACLDEILGAGGALLPVPAKIFRLDETEPDCYGFPVARSQALDELGTRLSRWLDLHAAGDAPSAAAEPLDTYIHYLAKIARNAAEASVLADYHTVFWLVHTQQVARLFNIFARDARTAGASLDEAERLKYRLHAKWIEAIAGTIPISGFLTLIVRNPLLAAEEFVGPELRELRGYAAHHLRISHDELRRSFQSLKSAVTALVERDRLLRRMLTLLGYLEHDSLPTIALFDPRVRQLLDDHPGSDLPDAPAVAALGRPLVELFAVHALRRGIVWMKTTEGGENVADDESGRVYSRATRPMNFGRRSVVEPVIHRYGLVYDINSFTETLGEIVRGGREEEQSSYRQMLQFQRDLIAISKRFNLQFEKFLGDGAFYTSRRATPVLHAAIAIQQFYAEQRRNGFAFTRGMRIAINYNYYRLLPMQVSPDGNPLMEFYGPGIVELSRLTTGKATKDLEDIQQLLIAHGYDQTEVYRFFAPLSRKVEESESPSHQREFFATVNENGHLVNEGIVVSIPFVRQFSQEVAEAGLKIYRLSAPWDMYIGVPAGDRGGYIGLRLLGSVALKGIGNQEIGEAVWLDGRSEEVALIDEDTPLLQLLQQERHRAAAKALRRAPGNADVADLVVCAGHAQEDVILIGEWDPVSEEVRRPVRLDSVATDRYGLARPLSVETIEAQTAAYQKLYRKLSSIATMPSFSLGALRGNPNFSGFVIGATVEKLPS
jgi:hypothetical protein